MEQFQKDAIRFPPHHKGISEAKFERLYGHLPVTQNRIPGSDATLVTRLIEENVGPPEDIRPCHCVPRHEGPKICFNDKECFNRHRNVECGSDCGGTVYNCRNQGIAKQDWKKVCLISQGGAGRGVQACEYIEKGELIFEYTGELYRRDKNPHHLTTIYAFDLIADDSDTRSVVVEATEKGSVARFMQHSHEPNAEVVPMRVANTLRLGVYAIKSIPPGQPITCNYGTRLQKLGVKECECMDPCNCPDAYNVMLNRLGLPELSSPVRRSARLHAAEESEDSDHEPADFYPLPPSPPKELRHNPNTDAENRQHEAAIAKRGDKYWENAWRVEDEERVARNPRLAEEAKRALRLWERYLDAMAEKERMDRENDIEANSQSLVIMPRHSPNRPPSPRRPVSPDICSQFTPITSGLQQQQQHLQPYRQQQQQQLAIMPPPSPPPAEQSRPPSPIVTVAITTGSAASTTTSPSMMGQRGRFSPPPTTFTITVSLPPPTTSQPAPPPPKRRFLKMPIKKTVPQRVPGNQGLLAIEASPAPKRPLIESPDGPTTSCRETKRNKRKTPSPPQGLNVVPLRPPTPRTPTRPSPMEYEEMENQDNTPPRRSTRTTRTPNYSDKLRAPKKPAPQSRFVDAAAGPAPAIAGPSRRCPGPPEAIGVESMDQDTYDRLMAQAKALAIARSNAIPRGQRNVGRPATDGWICGGCGNYFHRRQAFDIHLRSNLNLPVDPELVCSFPGCNYIAKTKNKLKTHEKQHKPRIMYKCRSCGSQYFYGSGVNRHMEKSKCPYRRYKRIQPDGTWRYGDNKSPGSTSSEDSRKETGQRTRQVHGIPPMPRSCNPKMPRPAPAIYEQLRRQRNPLKNPRDPVETEDSDSDDSSYDESEESN